MENRNFICHRFRIKCKSANKWNPLYDYANGMEMLSALLCAAQQMKKIMKIDLSRALPNNHFYSPQSDLSPKSDDEIEVEWRVWWMSRNILPALVTSEKRSVNFQWRATCNAPDVAQSFPTRKQRRKSAAVPDAALKRNILFRDKFDFLPSIFFRQHVRQ